MSSVRLTAAQALVRFLGCQWSERDGIRRRAVPGIFGIFGHGNVCGLGPALEEDEGRSLSFHQPKNEQAMVHSAIGYARACNLLSTLACTASIGPGSTNLLTGAATATVNRVPVLLLPSDTFANRRQGPVMQALEHPLEADLTVNDAFRPLSAFFDRITRPEQLIDLAARGDARPPRPVRDGRGDALPAPGRPVRGLRLPHGALRAAHLAGHTPASRRFGAARSGGGAARLGAPAADCGWRGALLGGRSASWPSSRRPSGSPWRRRPPGRARCRAARSRWAGSVSRAPARRMRLPARRTWCSASAPG